MVMEKSEVLEHAKRLLEKVESLARKSETESPLSERPVRANGVKAEITEFLKNYSGPRSSFHEQANKVSGNDFYQLQQLESIMESFIGYLEAGLHADISPERRAQIDVVSDFLDQANRLLEDKKVHPAPAAVLVGATLEEFLRTWIEAEDISLGNRKPGLQNYAQVLYKEELIDKQDLKDITSWGGIRNSAAHGEWEKVSTKEKVDLMLQGINLFMRKYST
jgi:hypothetical protein